MKIFTNKDIRNFFLLLSGILAAFIIFSQILFWFFYGGMCPAILLLSAFTSACIIGMCFLYYLHQNRILESAIAQINRYLSGDTNSRIQCDREGSLYKLFHSVNTLATVLNAQAAKEQNSKLFLKNTISDISHQLKTPLAALNIYNGLLQDETEDMSAIREYVALSEQELDRIEMLVQNLLKITKLDAGSIVIEKKQENLSEIMSEIKQHFELRAKKEHKEINLSGSQQIMLYCDRDWIIEALSNIVKNALDHTEAGNSVSIEWKKLPAVTQITVTDDGCGIHPEDIYHIFKRFYRSRYSKDSQGIGLGLPLAKSIIEAHDGNITVDSALKKGSTFVINFLNITKM